MGVANDNAASVSFEGLVGNLLRAGAIGLSKLGGGTFSTSPTRVCLRRLPGSRRSRLHISSISGTLRERSPFGLWRPLLLLR